MFLLLWLIICVRYIMYLVWKHGRVLIVVANARLCHLCASQLAADPALHRWTRYGRNIRDVLAKPVSDAPQVSNISPIVPKQTHIILYTNYSENRVRSIQIFIQ